MDMNSQNKEQRIQINLDLSPELYETINNLAQQMNVDNAEVLLKAIALLEIATEAKHKGKHFWIADDNHNLETEIVDI
ncbi:hypothetical protein NIES4103_29590 [Nostoc sp. NIES-4103]|nr:hypothetical protein NIES4103_29590 [Nostoc sp. NIES-4103]